MPEIGATLREARVRARIDVSEVEAETKIRAKYLRALENEEWDLLPGPTYVKSFLRTYAEALDLDAKLLVDEYKLRHEHLSEVELQPISAAAQARGRRRSGPVVPRWAVIGLIFALLIVALSLLGRENEKNPSAGNTTTQTTTPPAGAGGANPPPAAAARPAAPPRMRLRIVATGQVYVCLKDANKTLIDGETLQAGERTRTYRARRFRMTLGNASVKLFVNGRQRRVRPSSNPIGLAIRGRRALQPLSKIGRPYCE